MFVCVQEILQQSLKLGSVKFGLVCNVLHHHGLGGGSSSNDLVLDSSEAEAVVSDVFFAASKIR